MMSWLEGAVARCCEAALPLVHFCVTGGGVFEEVGGETGMIET